MLMECPYFIINPGSCKRNEHELLFFYFHWALSDWQSHSMAIWASHLQPEPLGCLANDRKAPMGP